MTSFSINPYARRRAYELDAAGHPSVRTLLLALSGMWIAALAIGAAGFRVRFGMWPGTLDAAVWAPLFHAPLALPSGLLRTVGGAGLGWMAIVLAAAFWPAVLGLQFAAVYRQRWGYAAAVAPLVALAAWRWTVEAVALVGL